ncbi:diiron oxygenase [Kitasatospora sp. NPDC088391]|uniref:diiron oxygenase n=1 Tax=Kitasatospora sp. NPDC088391 TaxID=3364074 RepID=UPI0037FFDDEF
MTPPTKSQDRFTEILDRLSEKSVADHYNPYTHFAWPDSLPDDAYWMSPSLLSIAGTEFENELTEQQKMALSKWESINFYSMNVHGIRELLNEVIDRVHTRGFEAASEFFHHFIGEENEHMWFFAEFCLRYGGKLYSTLRLEGESEKDPDIANLLVFSRILLFEELVDHFNTTMANDELLHETIREINRMHHRDESRHIAFGRELVSMLFDRVRPALSDEQLAEIEAYLKGYVAMILDSFCSPVVYRDAGLGDIVGLRGKVVNHPGRLAAAKRAVRKPMSFFVKQGIFSDDTIPAI